MTELFQEYDASNLEGTAALNPEDVADAVMYVLGTPPHVQVDETVDY